MDNIELHIRLCPLLDCWYVTDQNFKILMYGERKLDLVKEYKHKFPDIKSIVVHDGDHEPITNEMAHAQICSVKKAELTERGWDSSLFVRRLVPKPGVHVSTKIAFCWNCKKQLKDEEIEALLAV